MDTTQYHWHHIIPRHAGGTDEPSNLVRLSVEEHAEAHRVLWEQYGRPQDKLAWLLLSGKTDEAEAARIQLTKDVMIRRWQDPDAREKQAERMKGNKIGVGRKWTPTDKTKQRISASQKKRFEEQPHNRIGTMHTEETKEKIRQSCKANSAHKENSLINLEKARIARKGKPQTDHQKQRAREANAAQWQVTTPTGEVFVITNLRQYCLEHHLSQGNLVTYGHTKGYRAIKYTNA